MNNSNSYNEWLKEQEEKDKKYREEKALREQKEKEEHEQEILLWTIRGCIPVDLPYELKLTLVRSKFPMNRDDRNFYLFIVEPYYRKEIMKTHFYHPKKNPNKTYLTEKGRNLLRKKLAEIEKILELAEQYKT